MNTFEDYKQMVEEALGRISLPASPEKLYDPISYTLGLGGKRLRPMLTLAACELVGGKAEDALEAALGIEIFHNFTLLHDDIMDEAPLRRGHATVHKKWDANVAILSGDTMFALAYRYLCMRPHPQLKQILDTFTQTAIEVCEGQQFDMDFETQEAVAIADYLNMIRMKTAVLLGASLKIGALAGGGDGQTADRLYEFGVNAGMAFQLKDDLLDAFGNADKFGKSIGGDIVANKKTFLYLKCLELAENEDRQKLLHLFSGKDKIAENQKIDQTLQLFLRYKVKEHATEQMERYFASALDILSQLDADPAKKNQLTEFAGWLYKRDH